MSKDNSSFIKWLQRLLFTDPTLGILLVLLLMIGGVFAYDSMIKESLPDLKIPMASIQTHWHGAAAEIMEKEVTARLEKELPDLDNLKRYSSGSHLSYSNIMVEFQADAPLEESLNQLRAKISRAASKIPKAAESPVITQTSVRNAPIATFMLYGNTTQNELNLAAKQIKKELQRIPGISRVDLFGNSQSCARIQLIQEKLHNYNISPAEVAAAIESRNADTPLGIYEGSDLPLSLTAENALYSLSQLSDLPLKRTDSGTVIRLKDVALIRKAQQNKDTITSYSRNGSDFTSGIAISIIKGDGKDTVRLVDKALAVIEKTRRQSDWRDRINVSTVANDAEIISEELSKTLTSGWQSVAVVFLTLFFLLSWREATIAALCIPLTFLGSIIMLWALGYTFNVLMIIGMVLALGLLVDDFILVMEGMHDGLFIRKLSFSESAVLCIKNFAIPSLSGTVTTIFTFLPLAAIGGLDGKFLRAIPVTAAICLTVSYIVSILISIPLSRFLLKNVQHQTRELWIDRITHRIERTLTDWLNSAVIRSRRSILRWLLLGLGVIIIAFGLGGMLPSTLYPPADGRNLGITLELPVDYKLKETKAVADRIAEVLRTRPYLSSVLQVTGERDFIYEGSIEDRLGISTSSNLAGFTILFSRLADRELLAYQYIPSLRSEIEAVLADTPGYSLTFTVETGASNNEDPLQINLTGPDTSILQEISQSIQERLREVPGIVNLRDTIGQTQTRAKVIPDSEMLDHYGLSSAEFSHQLSFYLGDTKVTKLRNRSINNDIDIRIDTYWPSSNGLRTVPQNWREWQSIKILNNKGEWIPVSLLAELYLSQTPRTISHKNGARNITIMGSSMSLTFDEMHSAIEPILHELSQDWPAGYEYNWAGEVELAAETYGNSTRAFVIAVLAVFTVLVLQFKSFIQPLLILTTVIFGLSGVFYGFTLFAFPLSFPALIGMIALAGINVNDGIVLVDTMNRLKRSGMSIREAASRGAAERFRPIVSTTLTTLLGLIPLAIADAGWRPLCSAIIFGEILSTVAAMIITPALYTLITRNTKPRQ